MSILILALSRWQNFVLFDETSFFGGRGRGSGGGGGGGACFKYRTRRRRRRPGPPVYVTQTIKPVCFGTYRGIPKNSFAVFRGGMYQSIPN